MAEDDDWLAVFTRIMLAFIEPQLGSPRPTILYDYPVSQAALSRAKPSDPRLAERFELYVAGVELANAFGELTDAQEQRRRFEADQNLKEHLYGERFPADEDFLPPLTSACRTQPARPWRRSPGHAADRRESHRGGALANVAQEAHR